MEPQPIQTQTERQCLQIHWVRVQRYRLPLNSARKLWSGSVIADPPVLSPPAGSK